MKIIFCILLSLFIIPSLFGKLTMPEKKRGFNFESLKDIKIQKKDFKKDPTFASSFTFVNRKSQNSYFPQEKDRPAVVFRMTWGF